MQNIQETQITDTMTDADVEDQLAAMRERAEKREAQLAADESELPRLATGLPPKKRTVAARTTAKAEKPAKPEKAPKVPKVKAPKPERAVWSPSDQVRAVLSGIAGMDHLDKKGIAAIVKAAVELREFAKHTRMLAAESGEGEVVDTDGDVSGE